jgi:hypothetical protein
VVQPRHGLRFPAHVREQLGAGLPLARREELEGHGALELMVQRPEDAAHAAVSEQPDDLVPAPIQAPQPGARGGPGDGQLGPGDLPQEAVLELRALLGEGLHPRWQRGCLPHLHIAVHAPPVRGSRSANAREEGVAGRRP